jgi:hypothetical protein
VWLPDRRVHKGDRRPSRSCAPSPKVGASARQAGPPGRQGQPRGADPLHGYGRVPRRLTLRSCVGVGLTGAPLTRAARRAERRHGRQGGFTVPTEFYRQLVDLRAVLRRHASARHGHRDGRQRRRDDPEGGRRQPRRRPCGSRRLRPSRSLRISSSRRRFRRSSRAPSKVSDELLLDSAFDVLGFVAQSPARRSASWRTPPT